MSVYFRPRSLTWWSGVAALVAGLIGGLAVEVEAVRPAWNVLAAWLGGIPPAALVLYGTTTIGIRAAIAKGQEGRA